MKTPAIILGLLVPAAALAGEDRNFLSPTSHWFTTVPLTFDRTDATTIGTNSAVERQLVMAAAQTWSDVACTDITFTDVTAYDGAGNPANDIPESAFERDGQSSIIFEMGFGCSGGVLAYNTRYLVSGNTEVENGRTWTQIDETDTAFCEDINFGTPAEVDAPNCVGEYDLQGIALHEFGHGIGYAHTCEADEACGDPELQGAVMYWAVGSCDGHQRAPNNYDLETHSISYGFGSTSTFSVTNGEGGVPLDVEFSPVVIASASVVSVSWDFGDGTTGVTTGATPAEHTYVSEGRYSVGAVITANSPACGGDFTHSIRRFEVVVACNELEPDFHYDKDGKRVKFYSDTLGAAAGCLQILNWDFGDGATANVKNPIHEYATGGTYTVTLTASGPSGTSAPYSREVKVSGGGGGGFLGCSIDATEAPTANTAAAAGVLGIAVAMSLATVARRRID